MAGLPIPTIFFKSRVWIWTPSNASMSSVTFSTVSLHGHPARIVKAMNRIRMSRNGLSIFMVWQRIGDVNGYGKLIIDKLSMSNGISIGGFTFCVNKNDHEISNPELRLSDCNLCRKQKHVAVIGSGFSGRHLHYV